MFQTVLKASVFHTDGKITKGFTWVASVTDLNEVKIIQRKGTIMMIEKITNIT